ncbi:hypothetical protein Zmor_008636 [Zophobas morio]|jgi:hypothetical protein|uniref:Uncharacterized protein n=1 Tax=Zophobas morio TaxID=2755281 RepID=A0AA38M049_9CUCU|nr:hypothetical protein Zmor_008636 [Zophobas morio]
MYFKKLKNFTIKGNDLRAQLTLITKSYQVKKRHCVCRIYKVPALTPVVWCREDVERTAGFQFAPLSLPLSPHNGNEFGGSVSHNRTLAQPSRTTTLTSAFMPIYARLQCFTSVATIIL